MNISKLLESVKEAERFLQKADAVKRRLENYKYTFNGCRETGALKRASLDLSNSLADLRKSEKYKGN